MKGDMSRDFQGILVYNGDVSLASETSVNVTRTSSDYPPNPTVDRSQLPPGPPEWPILGQAWRYLHDLVGLMQEAATYGDPVTMSARPALVYMVNHPDLIQELFVTQHRRVGRGRSIDALKYLLGEGLITSEGAFHLRQRRLIQPHFHHRRIATYAETMIHYTQRHQQLWTDGMEADLAEEMRDLTLHIVVKTLFNLDLPSDVTRIGRAFDFCNHYLAVRKSQVLPVRRLCHQLPLPFTRRFRQELAFLDKTVADLITQRRLADREGDDLLSLLVRTTDDEAENSDELAMTDRQVRDETITLFAAGHETTAVALTWTFYLLATHPEWQTRWYAELDEVLGNRTVALSDLQHLTLTDQILTESMRLYPPVWSTGRMAFEPFELAGFSIPAGALLAAPPFIMHRDPRWFEEPLAFCPDRWTPEFRQALPPYTYFPFGGGPRRCIGDSFAWMEAQMVLATLGQTWHMHHVPRYPVEAEMLVTMRPKKGMPMVLKRRRSC